MFGRQDLWDLGGAESSIPVRETLLVDNPSRWFSCKRARLCFSFSFLSLLLSFHTGDLWNVKPTIIVHKWII